MRERTGRVTIPTNLDIVPETIELMKRCTIINTFLEQYDLTGKTIIPFATSGSSRMGKTNSELAPSCKGAILKEGKRFEENADEIELKKWADSIR